MCRKGIQFFVFVLTLLGLSCVVEADSVKVIPIELQEAPDNMEPKDEPVRVRVNDRALVRLQVSNLSPLDVCSLGSRTSTPVVEKNPFEALVTSIGALGGFGVLLQGAHQALDQGLIKPQAGPGAKQNLENDPDFQRFQSLARSLKDRGDQTIHEQVDWRNQLEENARTLVGYAAGNYRGPKWATFDPENTSEIRMVAVREHIGARWPIDSSAPAPTAYADSLVYYDQMVALANTIHKNFDSHNVLRRLPVGAKWMSL